MGNLDDESDEPVLSKRFKRIVVNRSQPSMSPETKAIEDEVCNFIDNDSTQLDEERDPLDFWKSCTAYSRLTDYAYDMLVVPCSSSASETLFSHAGFLSSGMRSRISAINLENQILIKLNKDLLMS